MRTKTRTKLVGNLTTREYQQCKSLNFRYNGCMMYDLPMARRNWPDKARVVMITNAETGTLLAWCLAYPNSEGKFLTQYYVRVKFRRQGFGDRLMRNVRKFEPQPIVMPHDGPSRGFFRKHVKNVTVNNSYSL